MNLTTFYEECQLLPETERRLADAFYKSVIDIFGEDNQDFKNFHKIHTLFYGNGSSLSKAKYYRNRALIRKLYDWLTACGAIEPEFAQKVYSLKFQDVVSDGELYRYYFKDLDAALDFVCGVGQTCGLGTYDDLLNIKALVILIWHQLDISELQKLHKSDLKSGTNTIVVGEREIQLKAEYFNILKRFAEIDIHKGFPSQKLQNYMPSPFLMRSARQINLSFNNIQKAILRFNSVSVKYGKELSILGLRRNGIFSQVYASNDDRTVNALIQELTGCDTAFAFGYKEIYEKWKCLIAGGDEN